MGLFDRFKQKKEENLPVKLLESRSPICDILAYVEKSETCYYFYMWVHPMSDRSKMKACWICNRKRAPKEFDEETMQQGNAPMLPAEYVAHDLNGMELDADKLEIVWFEDGNSASLLYDGELLCFFPGWIELESAFLDYSRYSKRIKPSLLEFMTKETLKGKQAWEYFDTDFWPSVQSTSLNALVPFFGTDGNFYNLAGDSFPPKGLLTGTRDGKFYAITLGLSMFPMPNIAQRVEGGEKYRRMELGMAVTEEYKELLEQMISVIYAMSVFPWRELDYFSHGRLFPWEKTPGFQAFLFVNPRLVPGLEQPQYEKFRGEDINLLWLVPVTAQEYEAAMSQDTEDFLKRAKDLQNIHVFDGKPKFS